MSSFVDYDAFARAFPGVDAVLGRSGRPEYRVRGKAFSFLRPPRKDAMDPVTGTQLDDVIVLRTNGLDAKEALLADGALPFFTTPHFDGWPGVLLRERDLDLVPRERLASCLEMAWEAVRRPTCRGEACSRRGRNLASHGREHDDQAARSA